MRVEVDETREITSSLKRAVAESNLSQNSFARAIGTSPARMSAYLNGKTTPSAALYLRALQFGEARAVALRHRLADPTEIARRVNGALGEKDPDETWALRLMLRTRQDLITAMSNSPDAVEAWKRRAEVIEDRRFDVLLQAIIGHEYVKAGEPAPDWTTEDMLDVLWMPEDPFRDEAAIRKQTPDWLAARGILISEKGLTTA
ncbi:helix-turn-helix transcriptional regulator [Ornithinimicrobium ciconiae]|uniref:Helix-turn-helix transcriptional regulator n=1 Tax=Ornithinimicrobium ciconiae TaxID=2594265 RepID=A0A516GF09_9MICO|nr:helix-turn-helix transcriptional regulator [Ornithinimicrobium ciconiae]QDO90109.1 helix-turn-helix transcriptional regulator [Ornithinimicrobium ciconiae]